MDSTNLYTKTVLVCYGKLDIINVVGYKYVIIEAAFYSKKEINWLKKNNKYVFAYLSLAEININSQSFKKLESSTLGKNENWDSYLLNLASKKTVAFLKKEVAKSIKVGFTGVFFDNIDNFGSFGKQTNQQKELITFIQQIDSEYPEHLFIQNSGLELIAFTHQNIDGILFESVASVYDFEKKNYNLRTKEAFDLRKKSLLEVNKKYNIVLLIVEYADSKEQFAIVLKRIKSITKNIFIGKIDLQTIPNYNY